jgi:hypothetical protein
MRQTFRRPGIFAVATSLPNFRVVRLATDPPATPLLHANVVSLGDFRLKTPLSPQAGELSMGVVLKNRLRAVKQFVATFFVLKIRLLTIIAGCC